MPVIGLGTWITFNVGRDPVGLESCAEVMRAFFAAGGRMVDSSPMYGSSEAVIGYGLDRLGGVSELFAATKVWTTAREAGPPQIAESRQLWRVPQLDLVQVHNLVSWEAHLDTLQAMKAAGRLRYVGITTSHGRRHDDIEKIMRSRPVDFVQVTYNPVDREVERRILPLAAERRIAVIANRPFRGGPLARQLQAEPVPDWAVEIGCTSWPQLLLKFTVSHPAVTCAIPATTRVDHVRENMAAAYGPMPDAAMRERILQTLADL
jgi:diketogulonate reductase-like aldo/keto reductase